MDKQQCNYGGFHTAWACPAGTDYRYIERCTAPATHAYRYTESDPGFWGCTCDKHVHPTSSTLTVLPISQALALNNLPDPDITGPCQVQSSPFCTTQGQQRMNPMDMLDTETSFRVYAPICQPCYDHQADMYVAAVHS